MEYLLPFALVMVGLWVAFVSGAIWLDRTSHNYMIAPPVWKDFLQAVTLPIWVLPYVIWRKIRRKS